MPFYPSLLQNKVINGDKLNKTERRRTAKNLIKLKAQIKDQIPSKDIESHLLLGTWNIRDLGKNGPKHGERNLEDLYYIAEILSAFDLVAVQEVNDLDEWEFIMDILGSHWDYIATDIASYAAGGNGERMTFLYDKRKVRFRNIAGEIVLPQTNLISRFIKAEDGRLVEEERQFARTPFLVSFQAGWFKFDLCTVHIYYGAESGIKLDRRIDEIKTIAKDLSKRAEALSKSNTSMIALGDFNIVHPDHKTMEALKSENFHIPKPLDCPSNVNNDMYYDQIAIKTDNQDIINFIDDESAVNGGVFDIFQTVMRASNYKSYRSRMAKTTEGSKKETDDELKEYFIKDWRTYRLSDHNPLWIKIPIDNSSKYLQRIVKD